MLGNTVLLQNLPTRESRVVRSACMLLDGWRVVNSRICELAALKSDLIAGALPVGSVEFVREAMRIAGIVEPQNLSYPGAAIDFLYRSVHLSTAGEVLGRWFVKPVKTKLFTGFVFDTMAKPNTYSPHDREQYDAFMALDAREPVWVSEDVTWTSEWRYYVQGGQIVGEARYDQSDDENAPVPSKATVLDCVAQLGIKHPYAIDFGVLTSGETALVEVNDAFAIGLYGDAMGPKEYLAFLSERWCSMKFEKKQKRMSP